MLQEVKEPKKENPLEELKVTTLKEHFYLSNRIPTNYYYKRWLWV